MSNLNNMSVIPRYQEVAGQIKQDIFIQGLKDGDFYCTIKTLCDRFQTSVITIRKAVALLQEDDVIFCRSAVGIYVKDANRLKSLNSFSNVVLLLSNHTRMIGHPYYDARLNYTMQYLGKNGFFPRVCSEAEINNPQILDMLASQAKGVISSEIFQPLIQRKRSIVGKLPKVIYFSGKGQENTKPKERYIICNPADLIEPGLDYLRYKRFGKLAYVYADTEENLPCVRKILGEYGRERVVLFSVALSLVTPDIDFLGDGRKIADRLLQLPQDTFIWVGDDFLALGVYDGMIRRGVDPVKEGRLLVNASPSFRVTESLGFPVIGFSPDQVGNAAASALVEMIKNPEKNFAAENYVPVSFNSHARGDDGNEK